MAPSTTWQEQIPADESQRHAHFTEVLGKIQQQRNGKYGKGRALHRKQLAGGKAELEVFSGLPDHARHGVFAIPGTHAVWVRLSNGGMEKVSDKVPDIRGFAIKIQGVTGPGALDGSASSQDFLFINTPIFKIPNPTAFVEVTEAVSNGIPSLAWYFIRTKGFFAGLSALMDLDASLKRPFSGFATESFWTVAPVKCGPYAMKLRLTPGNGTAGAQTGDLGEDFRGRLKVGALSYTLEGQFFEEEARTPIEDSTREWDAPFVPMAKLTIMQQERDAALEAEIEAAHFDPWGGLEEHRPLGAIMRARKDTYYRSQGQRK